MSNHYQRNLSLAGINVSGLSAADLRALVREILAAKIHGMRAVGGMAENAAEQGAYFMEGLNQIRSNAVKEIRGRGLMLAVELHPEAGGARRYCNALKERGILCKDTHEHSIRIAPPLVITRNEVDWALERFSKVLTEMA